MTPQPQEYCEITLKVGVVTRVAAKDYVPYINLPWYAKWNPKTKSYYAVCHILGSDGKDRRIYLHRLILGLKFGDPRKGDHIDHDTLNNIHTDEPNTNNLRIVTTVQNSWNAKARRNLPKGASYSPKKKLWRARIKVHGKEIFLGYFKTAEEAGRAYFAAAKKYFGEYACAG